MLQYVSNVLAPDNLTKIFRECSNTPFTPPTTTTHPTPRSAVPTI